MWPSVIVLIVTVAAVFRVAHTNRYQPPPPPRRLSTARPVPPRLYDQSRYPDFEP